MRCTVDDKETQNMINIIGKDEVTSSNLVISSINPRNHAVSGVLFFVLFWGFVPVGFIWGLLRDTTSENRSNVSAAAACAEAIMWP